MTHCEFCGYPYSECICELNADGGDWLDDEEYDDALKDEELEREEE